MICQRSGYCCINLFVVIVARDLEGEWAFYSKPAGVQCPNLSFDENGDASCGVHDEPWYDTTPCHTYQNSEKDPDFFIKKGQPCKLGPMAREREGGQLVQLGKKVKTPELEYLGEYRN